MGDLKRGNAREGASVCWGGSGGWRSWRGFPFYRMEDEEGIDMEVNRMRHQGPSYPPNNFPFFILSKSFTRSFFLPY